MIEKNNLIKKISKVAKLSLKQATAAYETVLKESPAFRKQEVKTVTAKKEVLVKKAAKPKIKKVNLTKQITVPLIKKQQTIKKVEVIKEVPVEVIKEVQVIKKVEVIKEVPVIIEKEVIKEVNIVKEVPVEVIKEVTLVREVEVVKEKIVNKRVVDRKEAKMWEQKFKDLEKKYTKLSKSLEDAKLKLKSKPKTVEVIKEIEIIKEVPVEIIKEVEVVKSIDFNTLQSMMKNLDTVQISKQVVGETRTKKEGRIVERRELKGNTKSTKVQKDDLKKIEGIGPKIESLLNAEGISSFLQLSKTKADVVKAILDAAGPRFKMHNPGSWAKQAKLAANGKWEDLQKLQDELNGGK